MTVLAASEVGSRLALDSQDMPALIAALQRDGRMVVGPTIRDGAISYDEIAGVQDLPEGWTATASPGRFRLARRADRALFGYAVGPKSLRRFLDPPRQTLFRARRDARGALALEPAPAPARPMAFLGVRPCDLAALAVRDRVLIQGPYPDAAYAARREDAFIVAVQCTEPAGTCFCASMGTGPRATEGFDLALTEVVDGGRHGFLVEIGSERGRVLAASLPARGADVSLARAAEAKLDAAPAAMGRSLEVAGLRERLATVHDHPRWDELGARCLGCANCTSVCPTCFCATVVERVSFDGTVLERERVQDSCFTLGFTRIHGGAQRASVASRYRQWLTHKLSTWHDQFGTGGCVGCGRCIAWCPAGIDITEEARALSAAGE